MVTEHPTLEPALDAERQVVHRVAGPLSYYVKGQGPPLLMLHSINAAASAYEMKPAFERLCETHRCYAVDLPGYGFSDRSARRYDVALFVQAVHDMIGVIREVHPGPVHAMGLSLSSEFLARAAREEPDHFATLTFVTPTGFNRGSHRLRRPGTREIPGLHGFLEGPPWRQALYDWLTSEGSIRYFLRRTYGSRDVDEGMVHYDYLTCRQPGARRAPYAFLSGRLFSTDIRDMYEGLTHRIWMPHGTRGDFRDFREADWARAADHWRVEAFPSGALVHFEDPEGFTEAYQRFRATES